MESEIQQSMTQKKIAFANAGNDDVLIQILKDCIGNQPLVGDTEFQTVKNAITLDVQSTLLRRVVDYLDEIRKGSLHQQK